MPPQGGCATFLCQPLDVLKTRLMNSKGEYQVRLGCMLQGWAGFLPSIAVLGASSLSALYSYPRDGFASHWGMGAQRQLSPAPFHCSTLGSTCLGVGLYFSKALALVFNLQRKPFTSHSQ